MTTPFLFDDRTLTRKRGKEEPVTSPVSTVMWRRLAQAIRAMEPISRSSEDEHRLQAEHRLHAELFLQAEPYVHVEPHFPEPRFHGGEPVPWIFVSELPPKSFRAEVVAEQEIRRRLEIQVAAQQREIEQLRAQQAAFHREVDLKLERLLRAFPAQKELSQVDLPDVAELEKSFRIEQPAELRQHLATNALLPVLLQAAAQIDACFGVGTRTLRMRDDRLVVVIETTLEVADAEQRLTRLRKEWWKLQVPVEDRTVLKLQYL